MAKVYKTVQGRKLTKLLAQLPDVQDELEQRVFEGAARAEEELLKHRFEGHAAIEVERGDVDWYVILSDDRGQKAAMSIEYGREGYLDENGVPRNAMEGLYILHKAFYLRNRKKRKVRL